VLPGGGIAWKMDQPDLASLKPMAIPFDAWGFVIGGSSNHWVRLEKRDDGKFKLICLWQTSGTHSLTEDDLAPVFSSTEGVSEYLASERLNVFWCTVENIDADLRHPAHYGQDADFVLLAIFLADSKEGIEPHRIPPWIDYINRVGVDPVELLTTLQRMEAATLIERSARRFRLTQSAAAKFARVSKERLGDAARVCRDLLKMPHRDWPHN
jgi:hypothetical protein